MAFAPVALTTPQYEDFPNQFLKAFIQGTTTPLAMATDATGGTTASKFELDAQGFPKTAGGARLIPFIDGDYDLWLFPTAAEADANDTSNAIQFADNLNTDALDTSSVITEAPIDSLSYVRNNAAWLKLIDDPNTIEEAPTDGQQYIRKSSAWSVVNGLIIDRAQTGVLVAGTLWAADPSAARSRDLPASPNDNDEIGIFSEGFGKAGTDLRANNITIGANGKLIDGSVSDKVLTSASYVKLKFNTAANQWFAVMDTNRTTDGLIQAWRELVDILANAFIDAKNGTWQRRTLAGNETLTFSLFSGQSVYLTVVPGANTLTLTNVTEWVGGAAPSTIEAEHAFVFWSDDGIAVTGMSIGGIS